jgi:hypothetical protein
MKHVTHYLKYEVIKHCLGHYLDLKVTETEKLHHSTYLNQNWGYCPSATLSATKYERTTLGSNQTTVRNEQPSFWSW